MSWLFSRALVEEFLQGICLDGGQCAQLSATSTQRLFWRKDKPIEFCRLSRSGQTLKLLTGAHGEALLTWYRAASPARTSQSVEMAPALTAWTADCGWSSEESSMKYDPVSRTWKTRQCLLHGGLDEFSGTWPKWGSMHDGECLEHTTPAWITSEIASGLWPTPTASDEKGSVSPETAKRRAEKSSRGVRLPEYLTLKGLLPGGRHNPEFSEWLMGWPQQWTATEPLGMDKFLEWQQQHSAFSLAQNDNSPDAKAITA
ncbi:hypothetical protein O8C52_15110 [Agrobacterium rhizogenes]|nr:hypothetical protein [Agrobacterium sp. ST15.13.015]MCZ7500882.1 hypothetical protein [Rhizobium rhizogenes]